MDSVGAGRQAGRQAARGHTRMRIKPAQADAMAKCRRTHRVVSRQLTDAVDRAAVDSLSNHVLIIGPAPMKIVAMLFVVQLLQKALLQLPAHHWCVTLALPCSSSTMKVLGAMLVHCAAVAHQQMRLFQLSK